MTSPLNVPVMTTNKIYAPTLPLTVGCGGKTVKFEAWQAAGHDKGSVVQSGSPTDDEIVAHARALVAL